MKVFLYDSFSDISVIQTATEIRVTRLSKFPKFVRVIDNSISITCWDIERWKREKAVKINMTLPLMEAIKKL